MYLLTIFIFTLFVQHFACHSIAHSNTLEAVHVVFRHGDRTPDSSYPNDPYINETYYPVTLGHLTNTGKQRAYNIGKNLRQRYGSIIGEVYTPGMLYAISSHAPRCKASLELLLAGLFPPTDIQRWNPTLNWQAIPYESFTTYNKMFQPYGVCSKLVFGGSSENTLEELFPIHSEYVPYILNNSGLWDYGFAGLIVVHSTIKSQAEWGLTLPTWTDSVWPTILTTLTIQAWQSSGDSTEIKILNAGYLLSAIVNNTYTRMNQEVPFEKTNLFLYSGHDSNIIALLLAFDLLGTDYIDYGSQIMFEVHNFNGNRHIKILHENYKIGDPRVLTIPGCAEFCPLDQFVAIFSDYLDPELYDNLCN